MAISEKVLKAVREKAVDDRISCTEARRLAAQLDVPISEIGRATDALKIKITTCELGCF